MRGPFRKKARGARAGRSTAQCGGPGAGQGGHGPWRTAPTERRRRVRGPGPRRPAARGRRAAVHGGPRAGAGRAQAGGGRRAAVAPLAPLGAPGGGARGLGWPSRGHGRARLGETSTMTASPPRDDDGDEKLDGGGFDGGGASLARTAAARISKLGF